MPVFYDGNNTTCYCNYQIYLYFTFTPACDENCDDGLMQCYGVGSDECCSYYNASTCVDVCPSPFVNNTEHDCVCPVGTTGHNCLESQQNSYSYNFS